MDKMGIDSNNPICISENEDRPLSKFHSIWNDFINQLRLNSDAANRIRLIARGPVNSGIASLWIEVEDFDQETTDMIWDAEIGANQRSLINNVKIDCLVLEARHKATIPARYQDITQGVKALINM